MLVWVWFHSLTHSDIYGAKHCSARCTSYKSSFLEVKHLNAYPLPKTLALKFLSAEQYFP
jgi:hypothetical protein